MPNHKLIDIRMHMHLNEHMHLNGTNEYLNAELLLYFYLQKITVHKGDYLNGSNYKTKKLTSTNKRDA